MPIVTQINVPTDLQDSFNSLVSLGKVAGSSNKRLAVRPSAKTAQPPAVPQDELGCLATESATWLTQAWLPTADPTTQSAFWATRYNEIKAGNLASPYWTTLLLASDQTALTSLTLLPYRGSINPTYFDPLRLPTDSHWFGYSSSYTTPPYRTISAQPSPGWNGQVQSGYFKDLWHAVHVLKYDLPNASRTDSHRPIVLHYSLQLDASATVRGNKTWFTPLTRATVVGQFWGPADVKLGLTHYFPKWCSTAPLPGPNFTGWLYSPTLTGWHYGSWKTLAQQPTTGYSIAVEIATPPSQGRYFARNDQVTVTHNDTLSVYWPLRPGET